MQQYGNNYRLIEINFRFAFPLVVAHDAHGGTVY